MTEYATKFGIEVPYSIPNKGPTPKIDAEEGLALGELDIAWVDASRKNLYHWSNGLEWHERLHAHATMNSARRNRKCRRPFEPKDELDFVLDSIYDPLKDPFSEKQDVYLQMETAYGGDLNVAVVGRSARDLEHAPEGGKKCSLPRTQAREMWRTLKNRVVIYPDKSVPRGYPITYADTKHQRKDNIYNVKLGIAADHSPQTNPGYSRTPNGAFYAI